MNFFAIAILLGVVGCAARPDLPSYDEKAGIVRGYYSHVSGKEYGQALGELATGTFSSADALSDHYCAVQTIGATDVRDVPDTASVKVTVVGYAHDGTPTTYSGNLDFSRDPTSNEWRLNAPNLARNPGDPQLVGKSCAVAVATASPAPSAVDLADTGSDVSYTLEGTGQANKMTLTLENDTDKVWTVKINKGLRLESDDSSVQRMVVTEDYEVELEPHEKEQPKTIDVACLDIALEAPKSADRTWRVADSPALAKFIDCTGLSPDSVSLQPAIWRARGASHDDFVALFTKYGGQSMTSEKADQMADESISMVQEIANRCGSLETL